VIVSGSACNEPGNVQPGDPAGEFALVGVVGDLFDERDLLVEGHWHATAGAASVIDGVNFDVAEPLADVQPPVRAVVHRGGSTSGPSPWLSKLAWAAVNEDWNEIGAIERSVSPSERPTERPPQWRISMWICRY